jgi:hypothetical protein
VFLREGCIGSVTTCKVLAVVHITFFLPSMRGWSSHSFMGAWGLSCSCSGEYWVSVCCRGRPSSISRVTDWHSIEELGFQCLDRRDVTLLQGGAL